MDVTIIVAMDIWGTIGKDNSLPWHLPADLKRFRSLTAGKPVVMGRKTWESLPVPLLPGRHNVVIGSDFYAFSAKLMRKFGTDPLPPDTSVSFALTFMDAMDAAHEAGAAEVCVAGGARVYAEALPVCDRLCLTVVYRGPYEGDTRFPGGLPSLDDWRVTGQEFHTDHAYYELAPRRQGG
jgi:dihydrofolate reductase